MRCLLIVTRFDLTLPKVMESSKTSLLSDPKPIRLNPLFLNRYYVILLNLKSTIAVNNSMNSMYQINVKAALRLAQASKLLNFVAKA